MSFKELNPSNENGFLSGGIKHPVFARQKGHETHFPLTTEDFIEQPFPLFI